MSLFKSSITAAFLLGSASVAAAQQPLTLDDALARALARNHDIRIERDSLGAADAKARGAYGDYDLQLRIDLGVRHHRDPVTSLFSGAPAGKVAASENGFLSSVSLTQLFQNGATATMSTSVEWLSSNSVFTQLTPACVTSLGVDLRQPLLRSRAIDPWSSRRCASKRRRRKSVLRSSKRREAEAGAEAPALRKIFTMYVERGFSPRGERRVNAPDAVSPRPAYQKSTSTLSELTCLCQPLPHSR